MALVLPEVYLLDLDGGDVSLHSQLGPRSLVFMWGSWCRCREELPRWQHFLSHEGHNLHFISLAVDVSGPEAVRPFHEAAHATFPTLVDTTAQVACALGVKTVPTALLVDREGTIHWVSPGHFSVDNPEDLEVVRAWMTHGHTPLMDAPLADPLRAELVCTRMRWARELHTRGDRAGAAEELEHALRVDPDNLIVRSQIWLLRCPERFHPHVDTAWQEEQLARERSQETGAGSEGCAVP